MKVVILAGGFGTRLSEETDIMPKPIVEIGGYPIIRHIMKIYSTYGYNDFIVCLGYKGYLNDSSTLKLGRLESNFNRYRFKYNDRRKNKKN